MKLKKQISVLMTAALLGSALRMPVSMADDIVVEGDEVIPEEEINDQGVELTADPNDENQQAGEGEDYEDIPLIEDDGLEVVTITDGEDLSQVVTAESEAEAEADAAAEKIRELMDGLPVELESADPERIEEYLEALLVTEDPTGSDGELEVGAYIEETMRSFGYTVSEQHFHEGFLNEDLVDVPGVNIIAERGANSDLQERTRDIVLVCAHYDSRTNPAQDDPLANDKSGAAALLETARILQDVDTNVDLCFMFLSGEEDGGYGSLRLAEGLSKAIKERIRCVIYVGSVGYVRQSADQILAEAQTEEESFEPSREQTGEADVPPYLVAVPSDESNDPGELLRALGQYRDAREMLAGDVLPDARTLTVTEPEPEEWAELAAYEEALERAALARAEEEEETQAADAGSEPAGEAAVSRVVNAPEKKPVDAAAAARRLALLNALRSWRVVTGESGVLGSYTDNGLTVAHILQPVDAAAAEEARLRPIAEEAGAPEEGQEEPAGEEEDLSVSASLDAAPAGMDILWQAGSVPAGDEAAPALVLSARETASFADYLAAAVSLYMRSQTSLELEE